MRTSPSAAAREALSNPLVAAATLMVDIREDGSVRCVVGRMDMYSRRYTFDRLELDEREPFRAAQLPIATMLAASQWVREYQEAPWNP